MQYTANSLEKHWMPFTGNRDFKADPRLVVAPPFVAEKEHIDEIVKILRDIIGGGK